MEKILVAINAHKASNAAVDFACYIGRLTHSTLTGLVVNGSKPETVLQEVVNASVVGKGNKQEASQAGIQFFSDACYIKGIRYNLTTTGESYLQEIINETRFADLLVVDPSMSFTGEKAGYLSDFIKEILSASECPVVIAPFGFTGVDEIVFAYDGTASSVFALKQFTYLFPELSDKKITVVEVRDEESHSLKEKEKLSELISRHYSVIGYQVLTGAAETELFARLIGRKNIFVIMGSYGRSRLSQFFHHSTSDLIVKVTDLPVFIAHR